MVLDGPWRPLMAAFKNLIKLEINGFISLQFTFSLAISFLLMEVTFLPSAWKDKLCVLELLFVKWKTFLTFPLLKNVPKSIKFPIFGSDTIELPRPWALTLISFGNECSTFITIVSTYLKKWKMFLKLVKVHIFKNVILSLIREVANSFYYKFWTRFNNSFGWHYFPWRISFSLLIKFIK